MKGGGPRVVVSTAAFHARVRGSVPGLGGLKETKNVSSPSTCESQYCGEPPWPRGSVLGLRPPGLEYRILCLEDSVISIISPICAQRWPKARLISFRPPLCTYRLNWARRTSWGWWDDWDDKPPRPGTEPRTLACKAAVLTTTLGPPPVSAREILRWYL